MIYTKSMKNLNNIIFITTEKTLNEGFKSLI